MLGLKDAIRKAFEHLDMIYQGEQLPNKLLEEVEYDENSDLWKVVIGFDSMRIMTRSEPSSFSSFLPATTIKENERKYKQIRLKGRDGAFVKMIDQML